MQATAFDLSMMWQALLVTSPLDIAEARTKLTQDELNITELFRENTPSVVFITNMASRSAWHQLCCTLLFGLKATLPASMKRVTILLSISDANNCTILIMKI